LRRRLKAVVVVLLEVVVVSAAAVLCVGDQDAVDEGDGAAHGKMTQAKGCLEHFFFNKAGTNPDKSVLLIYKLMAGTDGD
jgi:hypothetical protein